MVVAIIATPMPFSSTCQIVCMLLVQPAQHPHEQQDRDGDSEQPQQASASHFDLLVLMH